MSKRNKLFGVSVVVAIAALTAYLFVNRHHLLVLNPKGVIAAEQKELLIFTTLLSLIIVVPVFTMLFFFAWKYRADKKSKYTPNWDHHFGLEFTWWAIPLVLISILAVVAWRSSHELDPFKPLAAQTTPLKVQVIALQWRWLFIYPEHNVASLNQVNFPTDRPVDFEITADAPMNSFWIPQLGGQVYAMSGMSTQLHLAADQPGNYRGVSANLSGKGFADMKFTAQAMAQSDFNAWIRAASRSDGKLDFKSYTQLARPAVNTGTVNYALAESKLYSMIQAKYMPAGHNGHGSY